MTSKAPTAASPPPLFSVECTTCKARLKVRSMEAIGQILACPKCQSMVLVAPPADWHPAGTPPPVAATNPHSEQNSSADRPWGLWAGGIAAAAALSLTGGYLVWAWLSGRSDGASPPDVAVKPATVSASTDQTTRTPARDSTAGEQVNAAAAPQADSTEVAPSTDAPELSAGSDADVDDAEKPTAELNPAAEPESPPAPLPRQTPSVADDPNPAPADPAPDTEEQGASSADDLLPLLQVEIAALDEPEISLAALAELLGGLAACPITIDEASLKSAGIAVDATTGVKAEGTTVEATLLAALEPLQLRYEQRGKAIVIFAPGK